MTGYLEAGLRTELAAWADRGLRRQTRDVAAAAGEVDLVSNDYLGLARDPAIVAAAEAGLRRYGVGAGAARLLGGGSPEHAALEQEVADWLGAAAALLFPSGYQANLGLLATLAGPEDVLLSDSLNHASLIDACRLSRAQRVVFPHGDLEALDRRLGQRSAARRRIVVVEGVYGMDGDRAALMDLLALCMRHDAGIIVDEAHSAGVLGAEGAGAWAEAGLDPADPRLLARIVTGGKALGVSGALVVGSEALREICVHRARSFVFTTSPPPAMAAALRAAVDRVRRADALRAAVLERSRQLTEMMGEAGATSSAIVPVPMGCPERARRLGEKLASQGLRVGVARPPTVPEGTSRLRVVMHAFNSAAEVERLGVALRRERSTAQAAAPVHLSTADQSVVGIEAQRSPLFVVGTDTEIGKTIVSALLVRAARGPVAASQPAESERGESTRAVRYWKPVQTGDDSDTLTVRRLADCADDEVCEPVYALPLPASPHEAAAAAGVTLDPQAVMAQLGVLQSERPDAAHIVEFAGGLLVPYTDAGFSQADWLARARPPFVLVARAGLGTLNHSMLTLEALRARGLEPRALLLVGDPHRSNRETLERRSGVEQVIAVPRFDPLDGDALQSFVEQTPQLQELFT